jgi:hypothetical protein
MLRYSVESFPDGVVVIYFHSKFGVMPYFALYPEEYNEFLDMILSAKPKKDVFREQFKDNF